MQANCPQCSQRIVIDDARVPDRPFSVKCPKCQTAVKFPGKGAAAPAAAPASAPAAAPAAPTASPELGGEEMRAQMMAQIRREMSLGGDAGRAAGRALVAVPAGQAGSVALPLTRQGYQVDTLDNPEDGGRLLEQGVYDVVVTTRAEAAAGKESLSQRIARLSPENRRRVFVVFLGDEYRTGDGTQAWSLNADLVVRTADAGNVDALLMRTLEERSRLYQVYHDARKRFEAAAS